MSIFDAAWDAWTTAGDDIAKAGGDVVDWFSDAGQTIGAVLKFIAPIVALWPGVGTALSVALSAAAAYASGDKIGDAIIDIASAAIPGGVPRAIFQAAADIGRDALAKRPILRSVMSAARNVAGSAGGAPAVRAFDIGTTIAGGDNISESAVQYARQQIKDSGGGPTALAAFDAGVKIARGGDVGEAALVAARDYIASAGGAGALAIFDTGYALSRGKTLQDAGFAGLKALAEGNDAAERSVHFSEAMVRAAEQGRSVKDVLVEEIGDAFEKYGPAARLALDGVLRQWTSGFNDYGSRELAEYFGVPELVARAAQSIMRDGQADHDLNDELHRRSAHVVKTTTTATTSYTRDDRLTASFAVVDPVTAAFATPRFAANTASRYAAARAVEATPVDVQGPDLSIVQAPTPRARTGLVGDIVLGVTVAAALGALYLWATHGKAA